MSFPNNRAFKIVYEHCKIVDEIARLLIAQNRLRVDEKLVHSAALLHDIGYYPLLDENGYEPDFHNSSYAANICSSDIDRGHPL